MLAQSIVKVPAPAGHEAEGKAPGKPRGLAGFFADLLSQAQKSLGAKGLDTEKGIQGKTHSAALADAHRRSALGGGEAGVKSLKLSLSTDKLLAQGMAGLAPATGEETEVAEAADAKIAQARKAQARRGGLVSVDPTGPEAAAAMAEDVGRRDGTKPGAAAEDAGAVASAAALALAKPASAHAALPRAKDSLPGEDEGPRTDSKVERQASEPKVTILDLRRTAESRRGASSKEASSIDAKAEDPPKDAIGEARPAVAGAGREIYREFSLGAKAGDAAQAAKADSGAGQVRDFQYLLAERLRDAWNGDIVQSAHIVLKDGDAGTIRMRLRPESLGNIKIELNLSENNISGRIIVESDAAKSAFERNMNDLADAFRQGGFGSARLEVSVGGGSNGGGKPAGSGADSAGPFFSERLRSAVLSPGEPATAASAYARRGGAIDILA
jgi:flagellar protein FlbC